MGRTLQGLTSRFCSRMCSWALNAVYVLAALAIAPWLAYRSWRTGRYRRGWSQKLLGAAPRVAQAAARQSGAKVIWLHAVSVGEVNLLSVLIERLERRFPECRCVISTTTDTGYALACQKYAPRPVFYAPLDFSWAVRRAMRRVQPDLLVLAELELWPNLISIARSSGAAVAIANGRLSEHSAKGYGKIRWFIRRLLRNIDCIATQSESCAARFLALGAPPSRVVATGSVKFDGASSDRNDPRMESLLQWGAIEPEQTLWVAGSTQRLEEELAIAVYRRLRDEHPSLRLLLAPRHPERRDEVIGLLEEAGLSFVRRSDADGDICEPGFRDAAASSVLLVDVVGELGLWWSRADVAYVGGSMGSRGGQNMIEPAAYGCAVSFGPRTKNFRDVVQLLLAEHAAKVVHDETEMEAFVRWRLADSAAAGQMGERARQLVLRQQGAADRTCDLLEALLDRSEAPIDGQRSSEGDASDREAA